MVTPLRVTADLRFEVGLGDGADVRGTLTGSGQDLEVRVDRPELFAGSGDAEAIRGAAQFLAERGLRLHVVGDHGVRLVTLGAVRTGWWQRRATGSRFMRVAGFRGGFAAARGRSRPREGLLPRGGLRPPGTLFPLLPTFRRRPGRPPTTTHEHGGAPRLVMVPADGIWRPENPVHWLRETVTSIGSDPACDVVLEGLRPQHAEVRHTEDDEYVVVALAGETRVHGRPVTEQVLRTSARVELGAWTLTYYREEHADHGRPYGGRIGGELGRQRPQPPREQFPTNGDGR